MSAPDLASLTEAAIAIARRASGAIMPFFRGAHGVEHKADRSPVTEADRASEAIIKPALEALLPGVPVVAEESAAQAPNAGTLAQTRFWLVDPLDGTREFVAGREEFTINIALIERARPILGVLHAPALGATYAAAGPGTATKRLGDEPARPIAARAAPEAGLLVAYSRSHAKRADIDEFLKPYRVAERIVAGSALKFGWLAEGRADFYPRLGPTMEWDTAAGQAILEAAGGSVCDMQGRPLAYAKPDFRNTPFVARGRAA